MKRICICLVIILWATVSASARTIELALYPAKAAESAGKCRLLPRADKLKDADAAPLYEQAVALKPADFTTKQITRWLILPAGQLPQKEAEEMVQKHIESLKLVARAARCKECNWSEWDRETAHENRIAYAFYLGRIIKLWTRLEISRGGHEGALLAIQTGLGMSRHLGESRRFTQGLAGESVGHPMCDEIEQFMQAKDFPNLYRALASLPRPFIDLGAALENEVRLAVAKDPAAKERLTEKMHSDLERTLRVAKTFDTRLNSLQAAEAIRHYAAGHEGQLPEKLTDITDLEVPLDVRNGKAFEYRRTAAGAVLVSPAPEGDDPRNAFQYEISLKK